jgi:hypothetical protein
MILDALKKHVQCAEEVLSEPTLDLAPEVETRHLDLKGIDIVCKVGVSLAFYEKVSNWLKGKEGRRLFFIEDSSQRLNFERSMRQNFLS